MSTAAFRIWLVSISFWFGDLAALGWLRLACSGAVAPSDRYLEPRADLISLRGASGGLSGALTGTLVGGVSVTQPPLCSYSVLGAMLQSLPLSVAKDRCMLAI